MPPELLWGSVTLQLTHVSCQELENVGALQFIEKPGAQLRLATCRNHLALIRMGAWAAWRLTWLERRAPNTEVALVPFPHGPVSCDRYS